MRQIIAREQAPAHGADEFLEAADDPHGFGHLLADNLMSSHALRHCEVQLHAPAGEVLAEIDAVAFQMVLLSTLETLAAHGDGPSLAIEIFRDGAAAVLRVSSGAPPAIPPIRAALYHRAMKRMQGTYRVGAEHVTLTTIAVRNEQENA